MSFEIDWRAVFISAAAACGGWGLHRWGSAFAQPLLFFSKVIDLPPNEGRWKNLRNDLPRYLNYCALFFFLLAFMDPHFILPRQPFSSLSQNPTEGAAIYLLLDRSGSMSGKVYIPKWEGSRSFIPKIDLLKQVTKEFVQGRPNDMIGLVAFARTAQVLDPLTLDHEAILKQLSELHIVESNDQEGTAMGYAIYKTVSLIAATRHFVQDLLQGGKPAYDIKDAIIVLVTDGFQSPSPLDKGKRLRNLDLEEAGAYAKEKNVHLYIINIDPAFATSEFAPNRRLLERITNETGGQFFMTNGTTSLEDIYSKINQLEKSRFPELEMNAKTKDSNDYRQWSLYPALISLGLFCLLCASIWDTLIWRRMP